MSDGKPRRSPKNLPYPENESCLDEGCLKYGAGCCGADPTGEQCDATYCNDRVLPNGKSCKTCQYDCDHEDDGTDYPNMPPDYCTAYDQWMPKEKSIYEERGNKHRHGIPGECGTTLWHPIARKHRQPSTEVDKS